MLCVMRDIPCPPSPPPPRLARIMLIVLVKNSAKSDVTLLQKPGGLLRDSPTKHWGFAESSRSETAFCGAKCTEITVCMEGSHTFF